MLKESDTSIAEEGDALRQQVKKRCKRREERESSIPRLRNENRLSSVRKAASLQPTFRFLLGRTDGAAFCEKNQDKVLVLFHRRDGVINLIPLLEYDDEDARREAFQDLSGDFPLPKRAPSRFASRPPRRRHGRFLSCRRRTGAHGRST